MVNRIEHTKQSIYLPEPLLTELRGHQRRLDRSLSWLIQRCIRLGLQEIRSLPGLTDDDDVETAL